MLLLDILLLLSLVLIPYCPLKGKPSCSAYLALSHLMVSLTVITTVPSSPSSSPPFSWHSTFFPGRWLTNRFAPLYPNQAKWMCGHFCLPQPTSVYIRTGLTLRSGGSGKKTHLFLMLQKPPKVFFFLIPGDSWVTSCRKPVDRLWGPCFSLQPLCYLLLFPLVCFQLKEMLSFHLHHLPWSYHAFSLLSLNGACTIWTFPLLVDRICKYHGGFSGWFPHHFFF